MAASICDYYKHDVDILTFELENMLASGSCYGSHLPKSMTKICYLPIQSQYSK